MPPKQNPRIQAMGGIADHGLGRVAFSEIKAAKLGVGNLMSLEPNHIDTAAYSHWGGKSLSGLWVGGYSLDF